MADQLAETVGVFKVGLQLHSAAGPEIVRQLVRDGHSVFLDLKFHDIPNTVAGAVAAATDLGVALTDLHALGGRTMMERAVSARLPGTPTQLLAITILTSHDQASLEAIGITGRVSDVVVRLARLAHEASIDGVVASPQETAAIRDACGPGFLIVTPGIRPTGSARGDQARAATPKAARQAGADYLVVGRPITQADAPVDAAKRIVDEIAAAE
jgi:orotidine-5'-phosphate decarboxylase